MNTLIKVLKVLKLILPRKPILKESNFYLSELYANPESFPNDPRSRKIIEDRQKQQTQENSKHLITNTTFSHRLQNETKK